MNQKNSILVTIPIELLLNKVKVLKYSSRLKKNGTDLKEIGIGGTLFGNWSTFLPSVAESCSSFCTPKSNHFRNNNEITFNIML